MVDPRGSRFSLAKDFEAELRKDEKIKCFLLVDWREGHWQCHAGEDDYRYYQILFKSLESDDFFKANISAHKEEMEQYVTPLINLCCHFDSKKSIMTSLSNEWYNRFDKKPNCILF